MEDNKTDYKSELLKHGVIAFVPHGNSMWPTLKNGKQSVIVKSKTERLRPMDVALYQRDNGTFVLHRVIKTESFGYVICGDSQFTYEKVEESRVFGVMAGFYRGKHYVDVNDADYIKQVKKLYSGERRRKFAVKAFFFFEFLKNLPKRVLRKLFAKKKTEKEKEDV
ncbi:MAG: S24/S26 family peptidase [Clostridia bacterium]|nr:S24/S26 family peptidase [Clostridia bacterium]